MPIRWRLTLFNALTIGTILAAVGLLVFLVLREALYSGVEETVRSRALEAARTVEAGGDLSGQEARLRSDGVYVLARDGRGRVLSRAGVPAPRGAEDAVWRRALSSGEPGGDEVDTPREGEDYAYAVPIDPPEGPAGDGAVRVVEAGRPYGAAETTLEALGAATGAGLLAALFLAAGGAYVLARAALAPVDAVVEGTRGITEGDLDRRLPVPNPKDEMGRLASTINELLSRLEGAFARREEALSRQRRFAADAGHELRTPLTSIGGYARMLQRWGLEDPEAARKGIAGILREHERMKHLVEELLDLARGDEGAPLRREFGDLGAVAAEAARTARDAGGDVRVEYAPPASPVEAVFDPGRVRQVADILLDNALKHTPGGGRVRVAVSEGDGLARLSVSDTGRGIPEEHLPLVFERFYRADPARAGRDRYVLDPDRDGVPDVGAVDGHRPADLVPPADGRRDHRTPASWGGVPDDVPAVGDRPEHRNVRPEQPVGELLDEDGPACLLRASGRLVCRHRAQPPRVRGGPAVIRRRWVAAARPLGGDGEHRRDRHAGRPRRRGPSAARARRPVRHPQERRTGPRPWPRPQGRR